ncbi:MAG TPA: TIGR02996 domain-containing protein [Kofleriaceae bacterium]
MSDALLDEVLAHPHSDDPRRVYADWLSERGDPRGEFIAVQCELARKLDFDAARRENHLLREHRLRWLAELGLSYGMFGEALSISSS